MDLGQGALDNASALESQTDIPSLMTCFSRALEPFGLTSFLCVRMGPQGGILAGKWPDEWHQYYMANKYFLVDPVAADMQSKAGIVLWHDHHACDGAAGRVMNEAREFRLVDGLAFSVHGIMRNHVGLTLSSQGAFDRRHAGLVHFLSLYFVARMELLGGEIGPAPRLTQMERECLIWAAEGKSDWETGCILGISQHTVTQHVKSCIRKLGVVNRTQAVAHALVTRKIDLG